jgi:Fe2+ transport system protein FeoA
MLIEAVAADSSEALRLAELGLRPGRLIRVVNKAGFGGRLVCCGQQRLSLDREAANALSGSLWQQASQTGLSASAAANRKHPVSTFHAANQSAPETALAGEMR